MKALAILPILLMMLGTVSANYLVHLTYDNGKVTQGEVYYIDSALYEADEGPMNVTVGSYESSLSFPLLMMHDYADPADARPQMEMLTKAEAYIIVPEAPAGTNIVVSNATDILLNEPIKKAVEMEPKTAAKNQTNQTVTPPVTPPGNPPAACFPVIAVPTTGALAYIFGRKKVKKK